MQEQFEAALSKVLSLIPANSKSDDILKLSQAAKNVSEAQQIWQVAEQSKKK